MSGKSHLLVNLPESFWVQNNFLVFKDRKEAATLLAQKVKDQLLFFVSRKVVVLGIPRGGVVIAREVAKGLKAPFSIVVTKKIGAPGHEELAIGAMAQDGSKILDKELIAKLRIDDKSLARQIAETRTKIKNYRSKFERVSPRLREKIILLVDDGVATGSTVEAAILYLRKKQPARLIVASPVISKEAYVAIGRLVDKLIVLCIPDDFHSVSQFYKDFPQVTDEEVMTLLQK